MNVGFTLPDGPAASCCPSYANKPSKYCLCFSGSPSMETLTSFAALPLKPALMKSRQPMHWLIFAMNFKYAPACLAGVGFGWHRGRLQKSHGDPTGDTVRDSASEGCELLASSACEAMAPQRALKDDRGPRCFINQA